MSDMMKSLMFATVLCLISSILLTLSSAGLKPIQQKNIALDKQKNLLKSVGLIDDQRSYSPNEIQTLYSDNIKSLWVDASGRIVSETSPDEMVLPIALYIKDEEIKAYIIPIQSKGLWGKIEGYLALENDGSTILGFTVYKHHETPGLGGEIEKAWFQRNFVGKKIINRQGKFVSIGISRGKAEDNVPESERINYVDGISGATLTGKYLSSGIKDVLTEYEQVSLRFRKNRLIRQ